MDDLAHLGMDNQLNQQYFNETASAPDEVETSEARALPQEPLHWDAVVRCLFIMIMLALIGLLTWRPGLGRLSLIFSLMSPSHGDRLEWRAPEEPDLLPMPVKRTQPPQEWRLQAAYSANWNLSKPAVPVAADGRKRLSGTSWSRLTDNAWTWYDDVAFARKTTANDNGLPPQKSATAFRAGDILAWPTPIIAPTGVSLAQNASQNPVSVQLQTQAGVGSPSNQSAGGINSLPQLPAMAGPTGANASSAPIPALPPLQGMQEQIQVEPQAISDAIPVLSAGTPLPASPARSDGRQSTPGVSLPPAAAEQAIDWKNHEITGPIKDAYLIIYPKLQFIGLVVPGQGYIRKYNQVGVPRDMTGEKLKADDGRTPYGRYYIADRYLDSDGPRLFLSWPSPDDARRIGLDQGEIARIENAWKRLDLPPQDTRAGGGVGLNGMRQWVDRTDGGFSLEAPHMEEIFTALPDKAAVLIQP